MRLPVKNHLSGFIMVVFQVLFLLYVVKSYRRRFNFFFQLLESRISNFRNYHSLRDVHGNNFLETRGFDDHLKKNTYNGRGKDYHLLDSAFHTLSSGITWHPSVLFELLHTTFQLPNPPPIPLLSCALLRTLPLRLQQCCLALEGTAFERPLLLVKFWWHLSWQGDPQSQVLKSLFHRPNLGKNVVDLQKVYSDSVV